jgi:hypothetical protein
MGAGLSLRAEPLLGPGFSLQPARPVPQDLDQHQGRGWLTAAAGQRPGTRTSSGPRRPPARLRAPFMLARQGGLFFDGDRLAEYATRARGWTWAPTSASTDRRASAGWSTTRSTLDTGPAVLPESSFRFEARWRGSFSTRRTSPSSPTRGYRADVTTSTPSASGLGRYERAEARLGRPGPWAT